MIIFLFPHTTHGEKIEMSNGPVISRLFILKDKDLKCKKETQFKTPHILKTRVDLAVGGS